MDGYAQRSKLLVVDDNEDILKVLRFLIDSQTDVEAIYANSLKQAMSMAQAVRDEIFLTILDLNLPDAPDGEVVQQILALGLPAIVFTGNFDPQQRQRFLDMGVVDYVLKDNRMVYEYIMRLINRIRRNSSIKVLVVDDDFEARFRMVKLLMLQQLQILTAEDGNQAMQLLQQNPDVRLVITDHAMPEVDGFELVSGIRRHHGRDAISIIGVSDQDSAVTAQFLKLGASDYLKAPFSQEEFFSRIMLNLEYLEQVELNQSLQSRCDSLA